jgi:hypothetical protein
MILQNLAAQWMSRGSETMATYILFIYFLPDNRPGQRTASRLGVFCTMITVENTMTLYPAMFIQRRTVTRFGVGGRSKAE